MWPLWAAIAAVVVILIAVLALRPVEVEPGGALVWADEFDGPAGAAVDSSKWGYEVGGTGWGNEELERYTNSTENSSLDGQGHLELTIRRDTSNEQCWYGSCRYTSARLSTSGKYVATYGRLEARMKLPAGRGVWPAFWTGGQNLAEVGWPAAGEIDIMEHLGDKPTLVSGALHAPGYDTVGYQEVPALADEFHVFAVDWRPDSITWLVDNVPYHTASLGDRGRNGAVFGLPHYLLLNVAVGGTSPGEPDPSTVFPQAMLVDYVRVYALPT